MKLYVTKLVSKKTNKEYLALFAEKSATQCIFITFDALVIYRLSGKRKADICQGEKLYI